MSRPSPLAELLGLDESRAPRKPLLPIEMQARVLSDLFAEMQRPCPFLPGDLVRQRKEFQYYRWPDEGQIALVTELIAAPVVQAITDGSSPSERCDMVMLVQTPDSRWSRFRVESWRFEKYTGEIA